MVVAYLCIALLGLLLTLGGFYVSLIRGKTDVVGGVPMPLNDTLHKAIRAHGNSAEYNGFIALTFYILSQHQPPTWLLICMIWLTVARYTHFIGLLTCETMAKPNLLRFFGAGSTFVAGSIMCVSVALVAYR
ncbi:MAPEG family protein [Pseudoalteromonas sp. SMS1]|uniref:MAPEG family protein n=1 Tax=Pseudoalteromonas sp. SMS1 TaxID=2908894 RepID=UPI001F3FA74F|nr:MAPEG family protein [Pseudoalteromonas sp. SMS1]MCF2859133.1 MAPEG family protein [Pseudoalteromonas sp. SMS1]